GLEGRAALSARWTVCGGSPRCLLDVRGLGGLGVQGEGAGRGLVARAAARPRPDRGPAVGDAEGDAGPGGEGGGGGGPDRDAQSSRGGEDTLADTAGRGQAERRTAHVRDAPTTAGLRCGAGAAGERAAAAVEDRTAVLAPGGAGRGRAGAGGIEGGGARPTRAGVAGGAGIAVVAGQGVRRVRAADRRVAGVGRTRVAVVAVERRPPDACAGRAHVRRGAGIAVVAERHVRRGQAHAGAVAGSVHARVGAGARAPRCLEPAGRRATVPVQGVAVVALLAEVEDAVATGLRDLPDDRGELVRLDTTDRQSGADDAEEVLATAAARHGLGRRGVADRARGWRHEAGREAQERPDRARECALKLQRARPGRL